MRHSPLTHDATPVEKVQASWENPGVGNEFWVNLHMEAELVLAVEDPHGLDGLGDGLAAADEDAVNVKGKDEGVGDGGRVDGGVGRGDARDADGAGAVRGQVGRAGGG